MEIRLNCRVTSVSSRKAYLNDNTQIDTHMVLSTVGNAPHPVVSGLCEEAKLENFKGRVTTDSCLRVKGREDIWAMGDCAAVPLGDDPYCPPTAQFALRQGIQCAKNIFHVMNNEPAQPFQYKSQGQLAAIGHRNAVADIMGIHFSGFLAWFIWRTIYLSKLPGIQRKIRVMASWTLDLFFSRDISVFRPESAEMIHDMHFEAGDIIFQNNDPYQNFYIIKKGKVDYASTPVDHETFGEGDVLGGPRFIKDNRWIGHATPTEPVTVTSISRKVMQALFASKEIARRFQPPTAK
jgi:NADH dehydrogenase